MKGIYRVVPLGLASFTLLAGFPGAAAFAATTITVASHGAKCNGVNGQFSVTGNVHIN